MKTARRLGGVSNDASWYSLSSLQLVESMGLDVTIRWYRLKDGKGPISQSSVKQPNPYSPKRIWGCQGSVARSVAQMVRIECFWMTWKLSKQWWKEWHVVHLGRCHVDRCLEVYVGKGPYNAPFSTCTCVRANVDGLKMSLGVPQCGRDTCQFFKGGLLPPRCFVRRHVTSGCV